MKIKMKMYKKKKNMILKKLLIKKLGIILMKKIKNIIMINKIR
jgi:hypothetical protein